MCEVSSGTDNNINYSVNKQAAVNSTGNLANYSVNNQGGSGTSGNTNNSGNNQGLGGTGNHNNGNTSPDPDILARENNILSEFDRAQILAFKQSRDVFRMETTVENNKSLESAFQEQLNQPNLPQEEISRLQRQRQRMARQVAISTQQLDDMRREFAETKRTVERLLPEYTRIMLQDGDEQ